VVPGNKTAGAAFQVQITATTNGATVDTTYTGAHALVFSGPHNSPSGKTPSYPASVTFQNGVSVPNPTLTLFDAESTSLMVTDGTRSGSVSLTVMAAVPQQLVYVGSSPSCSTGSVIVGNGGTFTSSVGLLDTYGNTAPANSTTVVSLKRSPALGTLSPTSLTVPIGSSQTSGSVTFVGPTRTANWSVTVTASSGTLTHATCTVNKT